MGTTIERSRLRLVWAPAGGALPATPMELPAAPLQGPSTERGVRFQVVKLDQMPEDREPLAEAM
jgi:hypothetical protein